MASDASHSYAPVRPFGSAPPPGTTARPTMIKPLSAAISSILLVYAIAGSAHAQDTAPASDTTTAQGAKKKDKAVDLGQVIVTGTRSPKSVDEIPGAITVVSKEEIQHTLLVTEDATAVLARTVPGYAES